MADDEALPNVSVTSRWTANAATWRIPAAPGGDEVFLQAVTQLTRRGDGALLLTVVIGDPDHPEVTRDVQIPIEPEDSVAICAFLLGDD